MSGKEAFQMNRSNRRELLIKALLAAGGAVAITDRSVSEATAQQCPSPLDLRSLAVSAGSWHGLAFREILGMIEENKKAGGTCAQLRKKGLLRLQVDRYITPEDGLKLGLMADLICTLRDRHTDSNLIAHEVRNIFSVMVQDPNTSVIALAIASIAVDSTTIAVAAADTLAAAGRKGLVLALGPVTDADFSGAVEGAAVGGGIGAGIGAGFGGAGAGPGAAIGAIIGAVGGAVGSSVEKGKED